MKKRILTALLTGAMVVSMTGAMAVPVAAEGDNKLTVWA